METITITDPDGVAYRITHVQEQDRHIIIAARTGTTARVRAWTHDDDDARVLYAMFATLISRGDLGLDPMPRWLLLLHSAWKLLTFQSTDEEQMWKVAGAWLHPRRTA